VNINSKKFKVLFALLVIFLSINIAFSKSYDRKILQVPYFTQENGPDCWAASLLMITNAVSPKKDNNIIDVVRNVGELDGISTISIEKHGNFNNEIKKFTGIDSNNSTYWSATTLQKTIVTNIKKKIDSGRPVMFCSTKPIDGVSGHCIVIVGYGGQASFYVHNPRGMSGNINQRLLYREIFSSNATYATVSIPTKMSANRDSLTARIISGIMEFMNPKIVGKAKPPNSIEFIVDRSSNTSYSFVNSSGNHVTIIPQENNILDLSGKGSTYRLNNSSSKAQSALVNFKIRRKDKSKKLKSFSYIKQLSSYEVGSLEHLELPQLSLITLRDEDKFVDCEMVITFKYKDTKKLFHKEVIDFTLAPMKKDLKVNTKKIKNNLYSLSVESDNLPAKIKSYYEFYHKDSGYKDSFETNNSKDQYRFIKEGNYSVKVKVNMLRRIRIAGNKRKTNEVFYGEAETNIKVDKCASIIASENKGEYVLKVDTAILFDSVSWLIKEQGTHRYISVSSAASEIKHKFKFNGNYNIKVILKDVNNKDICEESKNITKSSDENSTKANDTNSTKSTDQNTTKGTLGDKIKPLKMKDNDTNKSKVDSLIEEGSKLVEQDRLKEALEKFEESLKHSPDEQIEDYIKEIKKELALRDAEDTEKDLGVIKKPEKEDDTVTVPQDEDMETGEGSGEQETKGKEAGQSIESTTSSNKPLSFSGSTPNIWEGGNNDGGFFFRRKNATATFVDIKKDAKYSAIVRGEIWGKINDHFSPGSKEELLKELNEKAKRSRSIFNQRTGMYEAKASVRPITIDDFSGYLLESEVYGGGGYWSQSSSASAGSTAWAEGWVFKGNKSIHIKYAISGGGPASNSLTSFLLSQTKAGQNEAKAILAGLHLVNNGKFTSTPYTGPKLDGSDMLKAALTAFPEEPSFLGDTVEVTAKVSGGKLPYSYVWSGDHGGKGAKVLFGSRKEGDHELSVTVTDARGDTVTAEITIKVEALDVSIKQTLPSPGISIFPGTKVSFVAEIKGGNAKKLEYLWQPHPEVTFDPFENQLHTTAIFPTVDTYKVWIEVFRREGETLTTIGESKQLEIKVIKPKIKLIVDNTKIYVGDKVLIKVQTEPKIDDDLISFWWEIKGSKTINAGPEANVPNQRAYSFIPKKAGKKNKVTVTVHAKAKNGGADLGEASISVIAKEYKVIASSPKRLDKAPWKWDPIKGKAVELPQAIATFQNAEVHCIVTPKPKEKVRYQWIVDKKGCSISAPGSRSTHLNAHETGTYNVLVKVSDKNGALLGKGSTTFNVTVSQRDLDVAKQKAEDQKKAQELLQEGRKLWKEGKLQQAIAKVAQAQKLAGKDKKITKTLKAMQMQKKDLDAKLEKAKRLISQGKLKEAEKVLASAARISDKYEKYKEVLQKLADAKKKAEDNKKKLAKILKDAKALKDAGKFNEAVAVLKKGSKQFPDNQEMAKLLKEVQKQQSDALKKMKEGQAEWKSGMLGKAVSTLKKAVKINPSNKQIGKVLKGMQGQKKMMDDALKKTDKLIEQKKFDQAKGVLKKAGRISSKYLPYIEMLKKLESAKKKAEQEEKDKKKKEDEKLSNELLKKAKDLWSVGSLGDAIAVLKKGTKQFVSNKKIKQALQKMQKDKKRADDEIGKAESLMNQKKIVEAKGSLRQAGEISKKYPPYISAMTKLDHVKKKVEEERIAEEELVKKVQKQQSDARKKMTDGQAQWKNGVLGKAVSTLKEAAKIDPSNRQIEKALKSMQGQKKMMDDTLKKADQLIGKKKFDQVKSILKKVERINSKYPPYIEMVNKLESAITVGLPRPPKPGDLAYAKSFAGKWNSTYGVMKLTVQGLRVSGNYTHDKGRIEAVLSQDGKTMKGTWAESPSYKGSRDAGKMHFTLSSDAKKIDGLWSYGDAEPTGSWTATRIVDTQPQSPVIVQPGQKPPKEIKPTRDKPAGNIASLIGSWSFGRSKHYGKPVHEHLCDLILTDELVAGKGYKIRSCNANESYWIVEGEVLLFTHLDGTITTRFTEVKPDYWEGTYVGSAHSSEGVVHYLKKLDEAADDTKVDASSTIVGKTKTSTSYTPNSKGDVFNGGHWAGANGGSDWIQKDFSSPQLVTGVYIGRASTDITTKGFRLILKLKKQIGEWITIDELHDTNINRTALSGGAIGKSIPLYTKKLSPAIKATAFRLEFYGNGWFDATDIRIYTSNISREKELESKSTSGLNTEGIDGITDMSKKWHKTIVATTDKNIYPDPSMRDKQADSNNYVIDGDESHAWVRLFFQNSTLNFIQDKSLILKLTISGVGDAASRHGLVVYCKGAVVGRVGAVVHNQIVEIALDMSKIQITDGRLELILKAAGTDAPYIKSKASGQGAELKIVFANKKIETVEKAALAAKIKKIRDAAEKVNKLQEEKDRKAKLAEKIRKIREAAKAKQYADEVEKSERKAENLKKKSTKKFMGTLSGAWSGPWSSKGSFVMNISEDGKISGSYWGDDKGKLSGLVSASGKVNMKSGRGDAGSGKWGGSINIDMNGKLQGNGTWNVDGYQGTWQGKSKF